MEFKKGDIIYHGWDKGYHYITKISTPPKHWIEGNHCLYIEKERFDFNQSYTNSVGNIIRLATNNEIYWFNECIKNKKYIPFNNEQNYEIY